MIDLNRLNRMADEYLTEWNEQYAKPLRNYWGQRTVLQLRYAMQMAACGMAREEDIAAALAAAWADFQNQGAITRETCGAVEHLLQPLAAAAKSITLLCIGHAHIDMNWMWSYDETVSVTLDTFRTMLDLMDEYPDYTFAQSQASVYEIVAKHDPAMLAEIIKRVHEGRWEVTASTWVEADRNMPNAESMARHFLYTRQYLAELLSIDPATLDLDYEPDTFGHHQNVPEILTDAGVKYYYHCRGSEGPLLYRWQAPSGRSVISYREPLWYNWTMDGRCAMIAPQFCKDYGLNVALRVYGVGDHGGGPTRRDLEKIIDMNSWPIFPRYKFGTYHEFYQAAEQIKAQLPVVSGELNFIFDGCYTTQTRIKRDNRLGENNLFEAEAVGAISSLVLKRPYPGADYKQAWKNILFNQFHDILPGSGTADTREYAMGLYQQAFALTNSRRTSALRAIADQIDSSPLTITEDISLSRSEGAGVGFPTASGGLSRYGRHAGLRRLFMVWNPLPCERTEVCELTIWDWQGDASRMQFQDSQGHVAPHQLITSGVHEYWGHLYHTVLVQVRVPATGYETLVLNELPAQELSAAGLGPRIIGEPDFTLENEYLTVAVSRQDGTLVSLTDKETGRNYADPHSPLSIFRLIEEDPQQGMTAWVVGPYKKIRSLHENIRFTGRQDGPVRKSLTWTAEFGNQSELTVTLALDRGERQLRLDVAVKWQEIGTAKTGVPQLNLLLPISYACPFFQYDIPMGAIKREPHHFDVPASSYALAANPSGRSLMLVSDSKYGFRGSEEGLSITLIRSSFDPDPWPEVGAHQIRLAIALTDSGREAGQIARAFCHPFSTVAMRKPQTGSLPMQQSLFRLIDGETCVSAIKLAEDGKGLTVRLYSMAEDTVRTTLRFWQKPQKAVLTDLMEKEAESDDPVQIIDNDVIFPVKPYGIQTVKIIF
ncbi:MAG: glycoside hydrolase family 38 C-terminal domain-containing protein [Clostridiaceae bacterium]|nr:glycoside hydrolase family 38 C-terminal domain-containing protein [Clostridiaceae bacterium]